MSKKTFVTIVLHSENLELRKDPAQIPYHAYKELGYDSTLVSYYFPIETGRAGGAMKSPPTDPKTINKDYPFLRSEVAGLKMFFLGNKGRGKFYEHAVVDYLISNARKIDVLNLIHFGSENIFYCLLYKMLNPWGKVYLKLDIDISFFESQKSIFSTFSKIRFLEQLLFWFFFKLVTVVSAESKAGLDYFKNRFNPPTEKLILLPNGVDSEKIYSTVSHIKSFEEKENIVLTVGRIGNVQKNNELLMEAIAAIEDLKDWKFYFVGPIEKGFEQKIKTYFDNYPQLTNCVYFVGAVNNPTELYEYYNRAKVFCLTSRFEGFPLVCCEAAFFGNYLLLSDKIYAFETLTDDGKNGEKFALNCKELVGVLEKILSGEIVISEYQTHIVYYAYQNLTWKSNIKTLKMNL